MSRAAIAALLLAAGSCTDSSMLVGTNDVATLVIRPSFNGVSLATAPVVDQVHLVLTRMSTNEVVLDKVITVSPGQTDVTASYTLTLKSNADRLQATIYLLQSGTVLYQGAQVVVARPGTNNPNTATVTVSYVGPGATAASVVVAPSGATISSAATQQFSATVSDASSTVLAGAPVVWSEDNATMGAINSSGLFTGAGRRGTVKITATTWSGVAGSATLTLQPAATKIVIVSGNNQVAQPASALPNDVTVETDGVDGAVSGVTVNFDAGASGGSVSPASVVTNSAGQATVHLTLGKTAGIQQFNATSPGLAPGVILATASTGAATTITQLSGDKQADSVGVGLSPFKVTVTDAFGNPVSGAKVDWSVVAGGGSLAAASSNTDAQGQASMTYTLGMTAGPATVRATLDGTTANVEFTATAIALGVDHFVLATDVDGQTGVVSTALPKSFTVTAADRRGNNVAGATVTFTALTAGGSVAPATVTTGTNGQASSVMTLGATVGTYQFKATAGKVSVTVSETAKLTGAVGDIVPASAGINRGR